MGTIRERGVKLQCYSDDHKPMHVHCFVSGARVIIDLHEDGSVSLSPRKDALYGKPKFSDIKKALRAADKRHADLVALWRKIHDQNI